MGSRAVGPRFTARPRAGDFQISRAEYVRLMGTRGVAAAEANATFDEMDHNSSNLMTVAKMQHYVQIRAGDE